jgi:hypothetical protein
MTGELSSLGKATIELARAGASVFPCAPRSKEPLIKGGFKSATRDEGLIRQWWSRNPDANIGLATGASSGVDGVIVVDSDGNAGERLLSQLEARFGKLPTTLNAKTPNGRHRVFRLPPNSGHVPCSAKDGLDIRADGGYVIAPPSVHPTGGVYEWDPESPGESAVAPQWLLDFARDRKATMRALRGAGTAKAWQQGENGGPIGNGVPGPRHGGANGHRKSLSQATANALAPEPWSEMAEARLRSALAAISAFERDVWRDVGFALHDLTKHDPRWPGRELWDEWSKTCPEKFSEADQEDLGVLRARV